MTESLLDEWIDPRASSSLSKEEIERLAKGIAWTYGSKIVMHRDGEAWTVAAMAGYGRFDDACKKYADAKWQDYLQCAGLLDAFLSAKLRAEKENENILFMSGPNHEAIPAYQAPDGTLHPLLESTATESEQWQP